MLKVISCKVELEGYLKSLGVEVPAESLPDVAPLKKSRWESFDESEEPEWMFDTFYLEVGRYFGRGEFGGRLMCIIDAEHQGEYVKITLRRGNTGRYFFTAPSKLKRMIIPRKDFDNCETLQDMLNLLAKHPDMMYNASIS